MNRIIPLGVMVALFAMVVVGCGNNLSPMHSVDEFSQPQALAKPAVSSPLAISADAVGGTAEVRPFTPGVIAVEVVGDFSGSAEARTDGVRFQFARSVSGRSSEWTFTGSVGFDPISQTWKGDWRFHKLSGMYLIRAVVNAPGSSTDPKVLGEWNSVPLNQGELTELHLSPGRPAEISHRGRVVVYVSPGQVMRGGFSTLIDMRVDREKETFTVYVPLPPGSPQTSEYRLVWQTLIDYVGLRGSLDDQGRIVFTGRWRGETANPAISLVALGVGESSMGELAIYALY